MLTALKAIPWQGLCLVAIATMLFYGGYHARGVKEAPKLAKLTTDLSQSKAVIEQQQDQLIWERKYELQLQSAARQAAADRDELNRVRSAPRARIVCVRTPADSGPVPGETGGAASSAAGSGSVPQAAGFDPTAKLYQLADDADDSIESIREFISRLPPP